MYTDHSDHSDAARRAIMKIYTYEGPLYRAVNLANQTQDRKVIPTLGPYARLLSCAVQFPPKTNRDAQKDEARKEKLGKRNSEGKELLVEIKYGIGGRLQFLKVYKGDDVH